MMRRKEKSAKRADTETRSAVVTKWPATDGLVAPYLMKQISECSNNAEIVNEYLREMDHEGLSKPYRSNAANWAVRIAVMHNKPYKEMTRDDVLIFLGTFQK